MRNANRLGTALNYEKTMKNFGRLFARLAMTNHMLLQLPETETSTNVRKLSMLSATNSKLSLLKKNWLRKAH